MLPDDRPHVDLVLRRLKKIRDAQGEAGSADTPRATDAANSTSQPVQAERSGSSGTKPAHVLYDMDADLALALQLSAAEAEAAERRSAGAAVLGLCIQTASKQKLSVAPL